MDFKEYQEKAKQTDQFGSDKERSLASSFWNMQETLSKFARLYDEKDRRGVNEEMYKTKTTHYIGDMLWYLSNVTECLGYDLNDIANFNLDKIQQRWGDRFGDDKLLDEDYPEHEQFPREITFKIEETKQGVARMSTELKNGKFIQLGARVDDNSHYGDGYRYHDVLHLSYMAILGWSPVIRALTSFKRKSKSDIDRVEDGARAINLEEALTALIYEQARLMDYFEGYSKVPYSILTQIERIVRGLEVHRMSYFLWEKAILEGYKVWREMEKHKEGFIDLNLNKREILFRPLDQTK